MVFRNREIIRANSKIFKKVIIIGNYSGNYLRKLIIVLIIALAFAGCAEKSKKPAEAPKPTIAIGKDPYKLAWISGSIIKEIAGEMGYPTKFIEGERLSFMYNGVAEGNIDIYPNVWCPTIDKSYLKEHQGKIEILGPLYEDFRAGLVVPEYVQIDSIDELKEQADYFNKKIIGVEPDTGMMIRTEKAINEYGLFDYSLGQGSVFTMIKELEDAILKEEPILFLGAEPDQMFFDYELKILEDPLMIYGKNDCMIAVHPELKKKAPDFYHFASQLRIPLSEMEDMLFDIVKNGKEVDEVARMWIKENRDSINEMIKNQN